MDLKQTITEYQCPGCSNSSFDQCYKKNDIGIGCASHSPGTIVIPYGTVFLGMPKGFNRLRSIEKMSIIIWQSYEQFQKDWSFGYGKFNVPCWKYLDEFENTLVRGLSPRVNIPFLHIFVGDARDKINCLELTNEDVNAMD